MATGKKVVKKKDFAAGAVKGAYVKTQCRCKDPNCPHKKPDRKRAKKIF